MPVIEDADEVTRVSGHGTESSGPGGASDRQNVPAYQPPGAYTPPGSLPNQKKRRVWPWVVGILGFIILIVAGLATAGAILIPRMIRQQANSNSSNQNRSVYRNDNYNQNSNSNSSDVNQPELDSETDADAPTDEGEVLAQLTELENEWTVANINADKKKLQRILADDYVGSSASGESQGKAQYLSTIERDTTIQKWDFDDLKVTLKGNRASLTGLIRLQINDEPVTYRFTDKFVWRDGRWQATGSEVNRVESAGMN